MPLMRLFTVAIVSLLISVRVDAQTDVVIFDNGDRLTGEVKSLEKGLLRFKTEATNTISIEWDNIAYLSSNQNIQVETEEGLRFLGRILRSEQASVVTIQTPAGSFELESQRVVSMAPIKETAIGRMDGEVLAGYNFTKADGVKQLNLGLDLRYRTELRILSLDIDATTSDSETADASQRMNLNADYRRLRQNRWLTSSLLRLTRNDELGIDLRTSLGAGGGRILRQSNSSNVVLEGGLLLSRENVAGGLESNDTVEAFTTLSWDWFRYDLPELDLSSTLTAIPNLSDAGRVRGEFEIVFRWEFIDDFFWRLSFYDSYDSDPQDVTAEKNDYGVNTSIAWDF